MIVAEIQGDIRDTDIQYIAHGVNCQGKMGSGVAKALFTLWPKVRSQYLDFHKHNIHIVINGTEDFLGVVQFIDCLDKTILNMFTQNYYGYDGKLYLSYEALRECFENIMKFDVTELAIPRIGCGLAGGDWEKVKEIINDVTKDKIKVTVYYI